jgi:hypothetical protein
MIESTFSAIVAHHGIPVAAGSAQVSNTESMVYLAIVAGLIAMVALAVHAVNRFMRHWRYESQMGLFLGLCKTHELPRKSRRLLRRIASYHGLRQPARLFVEPQWLDPSSSGLETTFHCRLDEIGALRNRLFT